MPSSPDIPSRSLAGSQYPSSAPAPPGSMHDRIASWCDCCSCEAEPRWIAVAEELGIDLSDTEPEQCECPDEEG